MKSLTELLSEMKARCDEATPGPWIAVGRGVTNHDHKDLIQTKNLENAEFIAHARIDIPRLVAALELAMYYIEGDQTWEAVQVKIEAILEGGEGMNDDVTAVRDVLTENPLDFYEREALEYRAKLLRILDNYEAMEKRIAELELIVKFPQSQKEALMEKALEFYANEFRARSIDGEHEFHGEINGEWNGQWRTFGVLARETLKKVRGE